MKFTDGYWQMRPGMIPHYAAQVYEVTVEDDSKRDTLRCPFLNF